MDTSEAGKLGAKALHEKLRLNPKALSRKMRKAVKARWAKYYLEHPEKRKNGAGKKPRGGK